MDISEKIDDLTLQVKHLTDVVSQLVSLMEQRQEIIDKGKRTINNITNIFDILTGKEVSTLAIENHFD